MLCRVSISALVLLAAVSLTHGCIAPGEPGGAQIDCPEPTPTPCVTDADADGSCADVDCDDDDKYTYPGAYEPCSWYEDLDCDGDWGCRDPQCRDYCVVLSDEAPTQLNIIRELELEYHSTYGTYVDCVDNPGLHVAKLPFNDLSYGGWSEIGYRPEALWRQVHGTYSVINATSNSFEARAQTDIDGDGIPATWVADQSALARRITPPDVW